jgi:excisionase family DNA binding protein
MGAKVRSRRIEVRELMSSGDVAKSLGVSLVTVHSWRKSGRLPAIANVGRRHLFERSDVDGVRVQLIERLATRARRLAGAHGPVAAS